MILLCICPERRKDGHPSLTHDHTFSRKGEGLFIRSITLTVPNDHILTHSTSAVANRTMTKLDDQVARDRGILERHNIGGTDLAVALHNFAESLREIIMLALRIQMRPQVALACITGTANRARVPIWKGPVMESSSAV